MKEEKKVWHQWKARVNSAIKNFTQGIYAKLHSKRNILKFWCKQKKGGLISKVNIQSSKMTQPYA